MKKIYLVLVLIVHSHTWAFDINGSKWPGGETVYYVGLTGISPSGLSWSSAFIEAISDWNEQTDFNFVIRNEFRNPCAFDSVNSVGFATTVCGSQFGSGTIAVTLRDWDAAILGPPDLVRADIVMNGNKHFDVYTGPLSGFQLGTIANPIDFRRVALHELGHALGLDHDNRTLAIMNPNIGNHDKLTQDDIDGVNTLYGGLSNCHISTLAYGVVYGALEAGDCTVELLMVGGDDSSHIDIRRIELTEATTLSATMSSTSLDSVLLLADSKLRVVGLDDNGGGNCDAYLSQLLPAGVFYLLSNTYHTSSSCGEISGDYRLQVGFSRTSFLGLGALVSLEGSYAEVGFSGGISNDNGVSYGNQFNSTDTLDIIGRIQIDPRHQGLPGFLVIAGVLDGNILLKNEQGQWVDFVASAGPPAHAVNKTLAAVEEITIMEDFVPATLDVTNAVVDFFVGYGLQSEPLELYYHTEPLNLILTP